MEFSSWRSIFVQNLKINITLKIEKIISEMLWENSDVDEYNIEPYYVGDRVVGNFLKRECTSHILKNLFKNVKSIIESLGLHGTGKALFSNKKIMKMTSGISRELM